jgi:hypothetical protein
VHQWVLAELHAQAGVTGPLKYWDTTQPQLVALIKVDSPQLNERGIEMLGRYETLQPCEALVWVNQITDKAASLGIGSDHELQLHEIMTPCDMPKYTTGTSSTTDEKWIRS